MYNYGNDEILLHKEWMASKKFRNQNRFAWFTIFSISVFLIGVSVYQAYKLEVEYLFAVSFAGIIILIMVVPVALLTLRTTKNTKNAKVIVKDGKMFFGKDDDDIIFLSQQYFRFTFFYQNKNHTHTRMKIYNGITDAEENDIHMGYLEGNDYENLVLFLLKHGLRTGEHIVERNI